MFYFLILIIVMLFYCSFVVSNSSAETESPYDAIHKLIKYYVLLGFLSIFFYWLAWSTWIMAAERQVRRIRFVIIHLALENFRDNDVFSYALFRNILRQEIGWFDVHNAGELSNRLIDDLGMKINQSLDFFQFTFFFDIIDKVKDGIKYVI